MFRDEISSFFVLSYVHSYDNSDVHFTRAIIINHFGIFSLTVFLMGAMAVEAKGHGGGQSGSGSGNNNNKGK